MALKMQARNPDVVFEFVRKLPETKIAVSDNMESRPKEVKMQFLAPPFTPEARDLVRKVDWWSELRFKRN